MKIASFYSLLYLNIMKIIFYPIIYLFLLFYINLSYAKEYNVFTEEMVEVKFISSVTKVQKEDFYIALDFNLKPGWKIYWRQPGDSGLPPDLDYKKLREIADLNKLKIHPTIIIFFFNLKCANY